MVMPTEDVRAPGEGLVTWEAGTVHSASGTVEMVVRIRARARRRCWGGARRAVVWSSP